MRRAWHRPRRSNRTDDKKTGHLRGQGSGYGQRRIGLWRFEPVGTVRGDRYQHLCLGDTKKILLGYRDLIWRLVPPKERGTMSTLPQKKYTLPGMFEISQRPTQEGEARENEERPVKWTNGIARLLARGAAQDRKKLRLRHGERCAGILGNSGRERRTPRDFNSDPCGRSYICAVKEE